MCSNFILALPPGVILSATAKVPTSDDDDMIVDVGGQYDNLSEGEYQYLESPIRHSLAGPETRRVASAEAAQPSTSSQDSDFGEDTFADLTRSQFEKLDPVRPGGGLFLRPVPMQEDDTDEDEKGMLGAQRLQSLRGSTNQPRLTYAIDDDLPTRLRSQLRPPMAQPSPRPPMPPPPSRTTTASSTTTTSSNDSIFSKRPRPDTPGSSQEDDLRRSPRQKIVHSPMKPAFRMPSPSKAADSVGSLDQGDASVATIHPKTSYAVAQLPFGVTWIMLFLEQIQPTCWEPIERLLQTPDRLNNLRESHLQAVNTLYSTNGLFTARSRPVLEWFKREDTVRT